MSEESIENFVTDAAGNKFRLKSIFDNLPNEKVFHRYEGNGVITVGNSNLTEVNKIPAMISHYREASRVVKMLNNILIANGVIMPSKLTSNITL